VPLTKELEAKILDKIKTITNNTVTIENIIDPAIIGGFVLRIGDKQYDSSITGILNSVLDEFEENHYIAKL
jgi:F-type H+-transporting ATPase subunit delta